MPLALQTSAWLFAFPNGKFTAGVLQHPRLNHPAAFRTCFKVSCKTSPTVCLQSGVCLKTQLELAPTTLRIPFRKTDYGPRRLSFRSDTHRDENSGERSTCLKGNNKAVHSLIPPSFQKINEHLLSRCCSRYLESSRTQNICGCFCSGASSIFRLCWGSIVGECSPDMEWLVSIATAEGRGVD